MEYLGLSLLGGILTILAPCVLPLLPVIIGGSLADKNPWRPYVITGSLALSVVLFSIILKASTALINVPPNVWKWLSGGIVVFFGLTLLFPHAWELITTKFKLGNKSQEVLAHSSHRKGLLGMVFMGMALGPVFASCSPAYFLILGTVLKESWFWGIINLIVYAIGLSFIMLLIALTGQKFMGSLKKAADPKGLFKKFLGAIFLIIGIGIIAGYDKKLEAWIISQGYFGVTALEENLVKNLK
ncbi:cytochrome C biogenesis protein [bacterium]|nr:cytochrome C biogenesis protein [bacterium]NCQ55381.1 cytochrome C biogenesis protein [Candidatus Parcubacteria bacterium]NCS67743.1 cytochrome C biogenesis protein [Candidatus Peregrinibacteria bacterium]NCS96443.1 cytochrome C biogenesis protein [bacterium]